jgi:methyltransferase (TIGR00027 family)
VILGAGFDSRAYRMQIGPNVRVFEVDHPSTQAMKRAVLGPVPAYVTYAPIDFVREPLDDVLRAAGLQPRARTLFLWEGVSNYLDAQSVDATLRFIGRVGSGLLFTYVDRAMLDGSASFDDAPAALRYVRKLGEPFTYGLDPAAIVPYMAERGLDVLEDLPLSVAAERYYVGRRPKVSAYYHVLRARCRA